MIQEVQSWTEQWENMSDVSLIDSYDNPGNTLQEIPGEMSQLLFGAPPNTEVESDSDCPVTDSSVTDISDGCPSGVCLMRTGIKAGRRLESSSEDYESDIAVLSDFSDDSSIFGIRKSVEAPSALSGSETPVQAWLCPGPPDPSPCRQRPMPIGGNMKRIQIEHSIHVGYMVLLWTIREEDFVGYVRYFTNICLKVNHDPRLDRYYPRLVRSLARAARVVRTLPHCRGNHRRRRDLMMRLFDDDMEQSDVARDRFPDRHVHKFTNRPHDKPESTKVTGTCTPPIYRNHHRKYAALRAFRN